MATFRQLKTFIATAEYKKMSEAAKHLFVSQPTVSQIISDLEKEYNTTLFERHAKELIITPAGQLLLDNARQIVAIHETLEQNMKTINSERVLRIGATMTVGTNIIAKIAVGLEEAHPDIDTKVTVTNTDLIEQQLLHNQLDIALVEGVIMNDTIIAKPALLDTLCIICGDKHPFVNRDFIKPDELHNQDFLLREQGSGTRAIFERLMLAHRIPYKVKWESTSTPAIVDGVQNNIGLGFVSERCITSRFKDVHICPVQDINLKRFFYICYNRYHPMTTQMQDFINYINTLPMDFQ